MGFKVDSLYGKEATTHASMAKLRYLIDNAKPRDVIIVCFVCHGSQMADQNGDEIDGQDEFLHLKNGVVRDDVIADIVDEVKDGVRVVLIVDSCFSGGATDRKFITISGCEEGTVGWYRSEGLVFSSLAQHILKEHSPNIPTYKHFITRAQNEITSPQTPQLICHYKNWYDKMFSRSREV